MSIYVISNDLNIKNNLFKVGRTKDTNTKIVTKYQRYLSGARLLLWYPSNLTNYVEDEKEIFRLFDLNRNRTPNGFKNEWLSISFEQLKTKMDEYFGQNGENFEEERKQSLKQHHNRHKEKENIDCEFCQKTYSCLKSLRRHQASCKQRKDREQKEMMDQNTKLQYEIQVLQQQNQELDNQKEQYEKEIYSLTQQNDMLHQQIKQLQNQIFEIAKQPTTIYKTNNSNNHSHNQKTLNTLNIIHQLADYDLHTMNLEEQLRESFTEEVFEGGPKKIIEMATQLIFTDPETKKPKIICTDLSRKNFKYRNPETGKLEVDPGFQKTHDIVRMPLAQANWQIYKEKLKQAECHREKWDSNNSFIGDRNRFAERLLPSLGNPPLKLDS
jgi:hypothetical protein